MARVELKFKGATIQVEGSADVLNATVRALRGHADLVVSCGALIGLVPQVFPALLADSHPEEKPGHEDGLAAVLEDARMAIANATPRPSEEDDCVRCGEQDCVTRKP